MMAFLVIPWLTTRLKLIGLGFNAILYVEKSNLALVSALIDLIMS
jgi:hypothetical protein